MDKPFLTIIMPVFKAEKYLNHAVGSILGQTFKDFELILIDDGSPDRCGEICDEFAAQDERVSVIHFTENKGVRITRNTAMTHAKGRYITFVDADDEIAANTYERIYKAVQDSFPHVVIFGLEERYFDSKQQLKDTRKITLPERYFSNRKELRAYVIELEKSTLYGYLWNKLYDAEYIRSHNITIKEYPIASDFFFNCDFFMDIETMMVLDMAPYAYNRRIDEGLTSKFFTNFFEIQEERVQSLLNQYEYWKMCTPEVEKELAGIYVRYAFAGLLRQFDRRSGANRSARREWLQKRYDSGLFKRLIPLTDPDNRVVAALSLLLKGRHTTLSLLTGRLMYVLRNSLPLLFSRIKQNR
ncbi:MAG TPA: hypothetical protein DEP23_07270 [Ruminococcaceae bacterium]|jgi:glycosyltransferase involved in cell wall biosynthesis|nr:hypothetical protein [Oscillospiraceae bacterium]